LELGKLVPVRTICTRPLTEIRAAPVTASTRVDWCWVTAAAVPVEPEVVELEPELVVLEPLCAPCVGATETCWTNGSLAAKWLKE